MQRDTGQSNYVRGKRGKSQLAWEKQPPTGAPSIYLYKFSLKIKTSSLVHFSSNCLNFFQSKPPYNSVELVTTFLRMTYMISLSEYF